MNTPKNDARQLYRLYSLHVSLSDREREML